MGINSEFMEDEFDDETLLDDEGWFEREREREREREDAARRRSDRNDERREDDDSDSDEDDKEDNGEKVFGSVVEAGRPNSL